MKQYFVLCDACGEKVEPPAQVFEFDVLLHVNGVHQGAVFVEICQACLAKPAQRIVDAAVTVKVVRSR